MKFSFSHSLSAHCHSPPRAQQTAAVTAGVQQGRNTAAGPSVYQGQIQQQGAAQAAEKVVLLKLRTNSLLPSPRNPTAPWFDHVYLAKSLGHVSLETRPRDIRQHNAAGLLP